MSVNRRTGRLRNAVLPLALAGLLLTAACSTDDGGSGAASPRAAADAYVEALNGQDRDALRDLIAPSRSEDERGAEAQRLIEAVGGDSEVRVVDVTQDVSPKAASARLGGTTAKGAYEGYVQLGKEDDGWWVVPAATADDTESGPTAGTEKPAS
ncbi:hypothetical protein [Streptomyces sp. Da 82-17]|uniref:hypothetical protein n=1 Tax=Streptomyces sp. Da 82-17 TaxID=3377116 RepID=UPI0038D3F242